MQSVAVVARQVSNPICRMKPYVRLPTEGARVFLRARKLFWFLQWTGWSDERDARAGLERFRTTKVYYWHEIIICGANYAVSSLIACF